MLFLVEDTPRRPIRPVSPTMAAKGTTKPRSMMEGEVLDGMSHGKEYSQFRVAYALLDPVYRPLLMVSGDPIVKCWTMQVELLEKKNTISLKEYEEQEKKLAREYSDAKDVQIEAAKDAMVKRGMGTRGLLTDQYKQDRPVLVWDKLHGWVVKGWHNSTNVSISD